jgi:hypothetical protein
MKNGTSIITVPSNLREPEAVRELVTEREPLLLNQRHEPAQRAVVRVQHELRQRAELRRAIPAVGAVNQDCHKDKN